MQPKKNYNFQTLKKSKAMKKNLTTLLLLLFSIIMNAQSWSNVGTGMNGNPVFQVFCFEKYSSELYAGGTFDSAGGVWTNRIAKWNGSTWAALGTGLQGTGMNLTVLAMAVYGTDLYIGGGIMTAYGSPSEGIVKWNGSSITAVGSGISYNSKIYALCVYNGELYAGGDFSSAGGIAASNIAKWNGTTWSSVSGGTNGLVRAMFVYGGNLIVGGSFSTAGTVAVSKIAKWNGTTWSGVGASFSSGDVLALAQYGSDLYVGGNFTNALSKWNGSSWSTVGTGLGMYPSISALAVYGGDLYAGGGFSASTGATANYITKWNGSAFSTLGTGTNATVNALSVYNNQLYAGGAFTQAGGSQRKAIARWNSPTGIEVNELENTLSVYPNPFDLETTISFIEEQKDVVVTILDVLGQEIKTINFTGKQLIIERGEMLPGVYFINIKTEKGIISKKIIINK